MSILAVTLECITTAEERVQRVAERLARIPLSSGGGPPEDVVDLSAEMAALLEAKLNHTVNASAARTSEDLDGHVLDILG